MSAVDPRLLRHARAARNHLIVTVLLGLAMTGLIIAQAALLSYVLAAAARGIGPAALAATLAVLLLVVTGRGAAAYLAEAAALRAAALAKSQLRRGLIRHCLRLGPSWLGGRRPGQIAVQATRGLDGLDPYFARYLPQLVLSVLVPAAVVVTVTAADWISGVVIAVTLPLIPLFAALVGLHTRAATRRQWALLAQLGGHFLDVVQGLPTLKAFGRAKFQEQVIAKVTDEHRSAAMATLRVAFLSALVLELSAALATAIVAVETGLRLLYGHMPYQTALLVLLLTPEAYLPLRAVAAQYHASAEGRAAADGILDILDTPLPRGAPPPFDPPNPAPLPAAVSGSPARPLRYAPGPGTGSPDRARARSLRSLRRAVLPKGAPPPFDPPNPAPHATVPQHGMISPRQRVTLVPDLCQATIRLTDVTVTYAGRDRPVLGPLDLTIRPGDLITLTGPSGSGKTTLLRLLLRFTDPASGSVLVDETDLAAIPEDRWLSQIAWVPQHARLFDRSVAENIALGRPSAPRTAIENAARLAGAASFIEALPHGYDTTLGEGAARLSAGQRQQLALARAFLRDAPLLLLDEPTAHLAPAAAAAIDDVIRGPLAGRTIILATHRTSQGGFAPPRPPEPRAASVYEIRLPGQVPRSAPGPGTGSPDRARCSLAPLTAPRGASQGGSAPPRPPEPRAASVYEIRLPGQVPRSAHCAARQPLFLGDFNEGH